MNPDPYIEYIWRIFGEFTIWM